MPTTQGQEFTANGNFVVPAGVSCVVLTALAGGGGGAGCPASFLGKGQPGGGTGQITESFPFLVTPGAVIPVIVGPGGAKGNGLLAGAGASGGNGGDILFGTFVVARGGGGGNATSASTPASGYGGGASGAPRVSANANGAWGTLNSVFFTGGGAGGGGDVLANGPAGVGARAINGHIPGTVFPNTLTGGSGAASPMCNGGNGGQRQSSGPPNNGTDAPAGPGDRGGAGGGAGAAQNGGSHFDGGAGVGGVLYVTWVA